MTQQITGTNGFYVREEGVTRKPAGRPTTSTKVEKYTDADGKVGYREVKRASTAKYDSWSIPVVTPQGGTAFCNANTSWAGLRALAYWIMAQPETGPTDVAIRTDKPAPAPAVQQTSAETDAAFS